MHFGSALKSTEQSVRMKALEASRDHYMFNVFFVALQTKNHWLFESEHLQHLQVISHLQDTSNWDFPFFFSTPKKLRYILHLKCCWMPQGTSAKQKHDGTSEGVRCLSATAGVESSSVAWLPPTNNGLVDQWGCLELSKFGGIIYPPGNESISHQTGKGTSSSKVPLGKGYVSSQKGMVF